MTDTSALVALLARQSARRGDFILASGKRSSFYIDARLTTMHPDGLALIGPAGLAAIEHAGWTPDAIGGLTLGADPIAYAISYASATTTHPFRAFTVRKEAKAHGTKRRIEGPFKGGDRVVIVEDVITTGASALQAAEAVRAEGGQVLGVLALVDREEGGRAAIEDAGFTVAALATASRILERVDAAG